MFTIFKIISTISSFSIILPFAGIYILILRKRKDIFPFDLMVFSIFIIAITFCQTCLFMLGVNHIHNLWIARIFIPVDIFLISLVLLKWMNFVEFYSIPLSLGAALIAVILDLYLGTPGLLPVEMMFFKSALFIVMGSISVKYIAAQKILSYDKKFRSYRDFLLRGILLYSLCNLIILCAVGSIIVESLIIHSALTIYANFIFLQSYMCFKETYS